LMCRDSQDPAAFSHSGVSSRESNSSCLSDRSSNRFPPEPRSVSIFETCSIDLSKTFNIATLEASVAMAVAPHKLLINLAIIKYSPYFSDNSSRWFPLDHRRVSIFQTCSIDLRHTINKAALGAPIALATTSHKIPINLAAAAALS